MKLNKYYKVMGKRKGDRVYVYYSNILHRTIKEAKETIQNLGTKAIEYQIVKIHTRRMMIDNS